MPTSRLAGVLHKPNDYQTISDFLLNLTYQLYGNGNAYIVLSEDQESMHLLSSRETSARRASETGDIYYSTGGVFAEQVGIEGQVMIPARFVGHVRLHTPHDPLIGVTPLQAAAASLAANNAITNHQAAYFTNQSRPSGVLSTEMDLSKTQMEALREAWESQAKALNSGNVPILGWGLEWKPMASSNRDSEMVEALRFSVEDIARAFAVPLPLIGSLEDATLANIDALTRYWAKTGLGFLVNHIEQVLAALFRLPAGQGCEFDMSALLRGDPKENVESLRLAVTGGITAPNEARRQLGLAPVEGGDQPLVQQQQIPLSAAATGAQLLGPTSEAKVFQVLSGEPHADREAQVLALLRREDAA